MQEPGPVPGSLNTGQKKGQRKNSRLDFRGPRKRMEQQAGKNVIRSNAKMPRWKGQEEEKDPYKGQPRIERRVHRLPEGREQPHSNNQE